MNYKVTQCIKHTDQRGYLVEFLKDNELADADKAFGQIYFVTFEKPHQVRGNHYHTRISEWFGVAYGSLQVVLEDVKTKERVEFELTSDDKTFTRLTIGPYIAHAFRNLTPTAVLLDYSNTPYDEKDHDRNRYMLLE
jgi:dTDP-4-dehydrorhamnose 3,5-epimerase-like enzyme